MKTKMCMRVYVCAHWSMYCFTLFDFFSGDETECKPLDTQRVKLGIILPVFESVLKIL